MLIIPAREKTDGCSGQDLRARGGSILLVVVVAGRFKGRESEYIETWYYDGSSVSTEFSYMQLGMMDFMLNIPYPK